MNTRKIVISLLLILSTLLSVLGNMGNKVWAVSKNTKAKMEYAKILSDKDAAEGIISTSWGLGSDTKFALLDINGDGVQELLFTPDDGYHLDIAAYVNGKVKSVGWGFAGGQQYYPNKKIYYSETAHDTIDNIYYRFNGKKMVLLAAAYGRVGEQPELSRYCIGKKTVSKKKYQRYVKKILKGAKQVEPKFYRNTKGNRNKYL